jgi:hypothetical protein
MQKNVSADAVRTYVLNGYSSLLFNI